MSHSTNTPAKPRHVGQGRTVPAIAILVLAIAAAAVLLPGQSPVGPARLAVAGCLLVAIVVLGWRLLAGPRHPASHPAVIALFNARDAATDAASAEDRTRLRAYLAELETLLVARLPEPIDQASLHRAEASCARDVIADMARSSTGEAGKLLGALQRAGFAVPGDLDRERR
ncbi:hypothetical protein Psesu_0366 [Pseudoxanthomonas suwonensis 11-1]|uniref:Transmembrane protein n=1 Tax=Pseudoxanthomonas suwonensis (strain 11-1) TaxID=743721 RepID=E6WPI3_PSEUU|nr:hypothetical protein [Pseudoxanthomonas suwonensis]ADV26227.1 hypothetical protein Psesu_0366 [Pseudoxanthomonas suwonensis 11-1]